MINWIPKGVRTGFIILQRLSAFKLIGAIISLALSCIFFGCSFLGNEITQYIALKDGKKIHRLAKVTYKVSVERQEVVYWVEFPGDKNEKNRSQLYKLKHCIVADKDNWEGEPVDFSILGPMRVEYVNGKFRSGDDVGWWAWYIEAKNFEAPTPSKPPPPKNLPPAQQRTAPIPVSPGWENLEWLGNLLSLTIILLCLWLFIHMLRSKKGKRP